MGLVVILIAAIPAVIIGLIVGFFGAFTGSIYESASKRFFKFSGISGGLTFVCVFVYLLLTIGK